MLYELDDYRPVKSIPHTSVKELKLEKFNIIQFFNTFREINYIYEKLCICREDISTEEIVDAFEKVDDILLKYDQNIEPLFLKMQRLYNFINTHLLNQLSSVFEERITNN